MSQTQQIATANSAAASNSCSSCQCHFRPLGHRVMVERLEIDEKLKGGLLLPDSAKKKQEQARVIAVGTGKKDKNGTLTPIPVQVGDIILMEKYSGQEVTINNKEYVILRADDLIAIVIK